MYALQIEVIRREFNLGKEKIYLEEVECTLDLKVKSKYGLFQQCLKEFGRCQCAIPMGWRFERTEEFDDGSKRWVEYDLVAIKGAKPRNGFDLQEEEKAEQTSET